MKRTTIIEQLSQKGFSKETLSVFTDKQLKSLHHRICETMVTVDSADKIKDVKKQLDPTDQIRVDTQEEDGNIGKFHKPVFKDEKKLRRKAIEMDDVKEGKTIIKPSKDLSKEKNKENLTKNASPFFKKAQDVKKKKKDVKESADKCCPKCKCSSFQMGEATRLMQCDECGHEWAGKDLQEMAIGLVEKNYLSLTTKKQIMETLAAKMGTTTAPSKPKTAPTRPAPTTQPGQKPGKNPYQSPRPLAKPHPKATTQIDKNLTSLPSFLSFDQIFGNNTTTAPVKEPQTKPAQPATRPGEKPKHNPYKSPRPLVKPHPKAGVTKLSEGEKLASMKPKTDPKKSNK